MKKALFLKVFLSLVLIVIGVKLINQKQEVVKTAVPQDLNLEKTDLPYNVFTSMTKTAGGTTESK